MAVYRNEAERIVELYDFDWKDNERMKEACICSVEGMIANILDVAIVFLFAALTGVFAEMLIFFISFGLMRTFAGGAHAKNYVRCVTTYICVMYLSVCMARLCIGLPIVCTIGICIVSILFSGCVNGKYAARQKMIGGRKELFRKNAIIIHRFISLFMILNCLGCMCVKNWAWEEVIWIQGFALIAHGVALFMNRKECVN